MKADLREIYGASTGAAAKAAIDVFADNAAPSTKGGRFLTKDRDALFFDFPDEHRGRRRT